MHRSIVAAIALTLATGLLIGQCGSTNAQSRRTPTPAPEALTAPPLIRTANAETPVGLRDAAVEVETYGSLSRTTLLLTLYNPNDRPLEGTLEFPLRAGQQVTGFALDIDGHLRDAVPVPKQQAQQVFESIERRNVDPGLLEQTAGNHFRLRVYPIPARGTRQVRLLIDEAMQLDNSDCMLELPVHLLAGAEHFSLRVNAHGLVGKPKVEGAFDRLDFVRNGNDYLATIERTAFQPKNGLSLRFPWMEDHPSELDKTRPWSAHVQALGDDRYVMAEIVLPPPPPSVHVPHKPPPSVGLLWDASASMRKAGLDYSMEFRLDQYFAAMQNGEVHLRILRDVGEDGGRFAIRNGDWSALRKVLSTVVYDGASNLSDWVPDPKVGEYLLVSDGLRNYSGKAFPTLGGQQRLTTFAHGSNPDTAYLNALVEHNAGCPPQAAPCPTRLNASGEGVEDLVPETWLHDGRMVVRVAGRMTAAKGKIRMLGREIPFGADTPRSPLVAALWANWKVASFAAEPELHRAEVTRIGQRFGIVTPGTSLLVLESAEDYVRYDIPAPSALREQVAALLRTREREREKTRQERLDDVAERFAERVTWWKKTFPKTGAPRVKRQSQDRLDAPPTENGTAGYYEAPASADATAEPPPPPPPQDAMRELRRENASASAPTRAGTPPPPPARVAAIPPPASEERAAEASADMETVTLTGAGEAKKAGDASHATATIRLQPWEPDSVYARRLRDAKPEAIYALYLDERDSHADSTAFYLDVADLLLSKGRRAEGLRVLSNLAELKLENRHILRVLGYRLMQAEDWAHAVEVLREVLRLADEEPQSHRDLGLALAGAGERQEAIRHLYDVAARSWDDRFSEVELVALNEMNEIIATSPKPLDVAFIDTRLLKNMPLDLRAVLSWDSDNSDMDLWVTDPNGEKCYYGNPNTWQGGLLSDDFTGGYGPEEFVLRDAKPGKYKVEANFFGDSQQIVTGATTLNLRLTTGWGTAKRKQQSVTLRLSGESETVVVGEFEVK